MKTKAKSLVNIFILFFSSFLLLFIIVTFVSYSKLLQYQVFIENISNNSITKIADSSNIFNQSNELLFLMQKLKTASTQINRRIIYKDIKNKVAFLKSLNSTKYLKNELIIIEDELNKFNTLINKKLISKTNLNFLVGLLHDKLYIILKEESNKNEHLINIKLEFMELLNMFYSYVNITHIKDLKQNIKKIKNKYKYLLIKLENSDLQNKNSFINFLHTINIQIYSKNGIINLKYNTLKINFKTEGKSNFLNSIIKDFSRQVKYIVEKDTQKILEKSKKNLKDLKKQIFYIIVLFVVSFFYIIFIILYVHKYIIKRLKNLDDNIRSNFLKEKIYIEDNKNDEISHIIKSLNMYSRIISNQKKKLEKLSLTDPLTKIPNRRSFNIQIDTSIKLLKRYNYKLSILLIDIDNFKKYNDTYGHIKGDECLIKISEVLRNIIKRDLDIVARFGGEEFIAILNDVDTQNAQEIAQLILNKIQNLEIKHRSSKTSKHVTASIGITTIGKEELKLSIESLISQADTALYEAKKSGKNKYKVYNFKN